MEDLNKSLLTHNIFKSSRTPLFMVTRKNSDRYVHSIETLQGLDVTEAMLSKMKEYIKEGKIVEDPLLLMIRTGDRRNFFYATKEHSLNMSKFVSSNALYLGISTPGKNIMERPYRIRVYHLTDTDMVPLIQSAFQLQTNMDSIVHNIEVLKSHGQQSINNHAVIDYVVNSLIA